MKWEGLWRLPKPQHDVHLVAIASGPGVRAPYWPTAKPYQPTSIDFSPYVIGVSGAVFVDADGSGTFESAFEYARRLVAGATDLGELTTRLDANDGAVAVQVASLLRVQAPGGVRRECPLDGWEGHVAARGVGAPGLPRGLEREPIRRLEQVSEPAYPRSGAYSL